MEGRIRINCIGPIWMPSVTCAMSYTANAIETDERFRGMDDIYLNGWPYDDREAIAEWLSMHSGDFQFIEDFCAYLPDGSVLPWESEDNEMTYYDCMFPGE